VLETVIITVVIVAAFIGATWYAIRRTNQRNRAFLDELNADMESGSDAGESFNAVFENEMEQQVIDNTAEIDREPTVTVSEQAKKAVAEKPATADVSNDEKPAKVQVAPEPKKEFTSISVNDWDMAIAFTIMASEGQRFSGLDLKVALENAGFQYDETQIYTRTMPKMHKKTLFSVANVLNPGTFEDITTMTTPGILIFSTLPGPMNGLTVFDDLLETALSLTYKLNGVLCDESRRPADQDVIETMRARILNMNMEIQSETSQYTNDYSD